jgi:hypothetical protein
VSQSVLVNCCEGLMSSTPRILKHAAQCSRFVDDRNPNFVLVDYVNVGHGALAVDKLNGF